MSGTFAEHVERWRRLGFWPRPIKPGTKACKIPKWQRMDPQIPRDELERWNEQYANCGIGLVLGSPFPDGTKLAVLDIDYDSYVRVGSTLLGGAICGRIGNRGIAYFVRLRGSGKYRGFKVKAEGDLPAKKIGELLCDRRLCVIPPTIDPATGNHYRWVGKPLDEIDYRQLPLIEA